jgi:hypothetical protein
VFARLRDGMLSRSIAVGLFLSRPFTRVMAHKATKEVAETLGAF